MKEFSSDPEIDSVNADIRSQYERIELAQSKKVRLEVFFVIFCGVFLISLFVPGFSSGMNYTLFLFGQVLILGKIKWDITKAKQIVALEKGMLTIVLDLKHSLFDSDFIPSYIKKSDIK